MDNASDNIYTVFIPGTVAKNTTLGPLAGSIQFQPSEIKIFQDMILSVCVGVISTKYLEPT